MKNWQIVLSILLILTSCNQKELVTNPIPIGEVQIDTLCESEVIIKNLLSPSDILQLDSLIVLSDRNASSMIEIYNQKGELVVECLRKGNGPGESTNVLEILKSSDNSLVVNVADEKLFVYQIDKLMSDVIRPASVISLPEGNYAFSSMALIDSSLFYVGKNLKQMQSNSTLYCLYDFGTSHISSFGKLEESELRDYPMYDFTIQTIFQAEPLPKPNSTMVVVPFYYCLGFEIVDIQKREILNSTFYTKPDVEIITLPDFNINAVKKRENTYVGFLDCDCSDEHIYLLCSQKKFGDSTYGNGRYILEYDWSGSFNHCYVLKDEVSSFCRSSDGLSFLCVRETESGADVVKYYK